jgi:hypothetical protein
MRIRSGINKVGFGAMWVTAKGNGVPPDGGGGSSADLGGRTSELLDRIDYWSRVRPGVVPR